MACQTSDGFPSKCRCDALASTNCSKNPGHKNFVPVQSFTAKLLPRCYRKDPDVLKLIHVISDLTVKLEVNYISPDRPKELQLTPNLTATYPLSDENGYTEDPQCGTGIVSAVEESGSAWKVYINTCRHVVFDSVEALNTVCSLSFEFSGYHSEKLCPSDVVLSDVDKDVCLIECTVTDKTLAMMLKKLSDDLRRFSRRVFDLYKRVRECERKVIIISFPHATSKHVTVGNAIFPPKSSGAISYDTNTCPCCSGAYVLYLGGDSSLHTCLHRGSHSDGTNFSTDTFEMGDKLTDLMHPPNHSLLDV